LKLTYDEAGKRAIVAVVNSASGHVMYQMPTQEVLRLATESRQKNRHAVSLGLGWIEA
jgi:uncharacterized FlaG/YvyC family protein